LKELFGIEGFSRYLHIFFGLFGLIQVFNSSILSNSDSIYSTYVKVSVVWVQ